MSSNFDELLKIQRLAADRLMRETEVDSKIKFLELIRSISTYKKIQVEQVLVAAYEEGYSEQDSLSLIDDLISDEFLTQPEPGYVQIKP
ncbi:MAG: hypothetical protein ACMXX9_01265 [Candidatus Woesearchaeota archaeon]